MLEADRTRARRTAARRAAIRRRRVGSALVAVSAVLVTGVALAAHRSAVPAAARHAKATAATDGATRVPPATAPDATTRPRSPRVSRPGTARVVGSAPTSVKGVALTFDDGYCVRCVGALVTAVESTGAHVTFCPNGAYDRAWRPYAARIRTLVAGGQVELCNHTFTHAYLPALTATAVRRELERNDAWILRTFGVSAKPLFRPPYGAYNATTLAVAGSLGYTRVLMWSGTLADSSQRTHAYLLRAIRYWGKPGAIILGHGNYPGTGAVLPQIVAILKGRGLQTMTVSELLAGQRAARA